MGNQPSASSGDLAEQVLARHLLAPEPEVAGFADREGRAVGPSDLGLDAGNEAAGRAQAGADRRIVALDGRPVVLGPEEGDGRAGLGQTVGVDEVGGREQLQSAGHDGRGDPGPAIGKRSEGGHAGVLLAGQGLDDPRQHGGHDHGVGHLLLADGVEPDLRAEGVEVDEPSSGVEVADQIGDTGHVVGRDGDGDGIALLGPPEIDRGEDIGEEVAVSQDGRLRCRCRAAGVQQDTDAFGVVRPLFARRTDRGRGHPVVPVDHGMVHTRQAGLGQFVRDDQDVLVLVEQPGHLLVSQPVVDRKYGDSGPRAGEDGDGEGGRIGAHVGDVGDAVPPDPRRGDAGPAVELLVAEPVVSTADGHTGRVAGHGHVEQHHEIHGLVFLCSVDPLWHPKRPPKGDAIPPYPGLEAACRFPGGSAGARSDRGTTMPPQ